MHSLLVHLPSTKQELRPLQADNLVNMVAPTPQTSSSQVDRYNVPKKVHYSMLVSLALAIAFCIPHGVHTSHLAPALGLIPQGLGAALALYRSGLLRKKCSSHEYQIVLTNDGEDSPKSKITAERILFLIADVALMAGLITTIVFAFLTNSIRCNSWYYNNRYSRYCYDDGLSMLAAYGTVPLLFNA